MAELWVCRDAAGCQRLSHGATEIEPTRPHPTASGQPGCQLPCERPDGILHLVEVAGSGMHQVDILDERPSQGARHRITTAIGHESSSNLFLDFLPQTLDPGLHLLAEQTPVEIGQILIIGEGRDQSLLEIGQIKPAQRSVQVVGPADWPAWLHPGQLVDSGTGATPDRLLVETGQRLEERIEETIDIERGWLTEIRPFGIGLRSVLPGLLGLERLLRDHREIDVEGSIEGALMSQVLDES